MNMHRLSIIRNGCTTSMYSVLCLTKRLKIFPKLVSFCRHYFLPVHHILRLVHNFQSLFTKKKIVSSNFEECRSLKLLLLSKINFVNSFSFCSPCIRKSKNQHWGKVVICLHCLLVLEYSYFLNWKGNVPIIYASKWR